MPKLDLYESRSLGRICYLMIILYLLLTEEMKYPFLSSEVRNIY